MAENVKLVTVGDAGVGKRSMLAKYFADNFFEDDIPSAPGVLNECVSAVTAQCESRCFLTQPHKQADVLLKSWSMARTFA